MEKAVKRIKASDFVHLHNHSHYSLLDGLQKIPEMLERVKNLGMKAVSLTDHGTLSGAIQFYQEAHAREIKPIIGLEAYMAPRGHRDKVGKEDANPYHLTILAMNNQGYSNMMRLSSISYLEGFYYKPRIDRALLKKYQAGLIVLSGCINGELGVAIRNGQLAQAEAIIKWYKAVFGDRYYLEVQDHGEEWGLQKQVNEQLLELGAKHQIPVVVTADAHYATAEDQDAHEVLLCVQTGSQLSDEKRMTLKDMHLFITDPLDIAKRWRDNLEVLTNTAKVADRCHISIDFGKLLIPSFKTPPGLNEKTYLERLAYQGLAWRYGGISKLKAQTLDSADAPKFVDKQKIERMRFELKVINKMNLSGYFLIVADFINWAKDRGIIIGPGRGSAAGSIVSYSLNITDLEPMAYNLLFERFLNPDRISMPDIDIDFQDDRRDKVIKYVIDKYGADRVAHIATFGTMAARNAIRDTSRVLGVPYAEADRLAKMIPPPIQGRHTRLATHIKENLDLKQEYAENEVSRKVIDLAIRLEGTIRSHGVHAAGVVIAPDEITKFTPLEVAQKGVVATQYSMGPIEELGLLKMDFLGLSNLTIIKNALRIIRKVNAKDINIYKIPLDDKPTYKLLSRGATTGVFQLESAGMKRFLQELRPTQFEDIMAIVSLYRPGPIAEWPKFIAGKNDPGKISYPHPALEPILKETYGVMVYQEQIIAMLQLIAGYTPGQADLVRKAIGKKKRDIMAAEKPRFIEGCKSHGLSNQEAEKLWSLIQPFADYSFNKSHAACYAMIAYQTAYLKAHFPEAFMAALLTSDFEDTDRIAIEVAECRKMGIEVLPPDVNSSFVEFGVSAKSTIRFGLAAIKNVGKGAAEAIVNERQAGGVYASLEDFARRVSPQYVNRKTWESLIKAGAFDSLDERSRLLYNLDAILSYASKIQKEILSGQVDLFKDITGARLSQRINLIEPPDDLNEREKLQWERQLLGLYLSNHPLEDYRDWLENETTQLSSIGSDHEAQTVKVAGFITAVRKIVTRNGMNMAFVELEDLSGKLELIVFPKIFQASGDLWESDRVLVIEGRVSSKDREGRAGAELKILVEKAAELDHDTARGSGPERPVASGSHPSVAAVGERLVIHISGADYKQKLTALRELLNRFPGEGEVVVIVGDDRSTRIKLPFGVSPSAELKRRLSELFSQAAVVVES